MRHGSNTAHVATWAHAPVVVEHMETRVGGSHAQAPQHRRHEELEREQQVHERDDEDELAGVLAPHAVRRAVHIHHGAGARHRQQPSGDVHNAELIVCYHDCRKVARGYLLAPLVHAKPDTRPTDRCQPCSLPRPCQRTQGATTSAESQAPGRRGHQNESIATLGNRTAPSLAVCRTYGSSGHA